MPRADLLLQLVKSGSNGDKLLFRKVVEAIIAEEKAKQHTSLANKLQESLSVLELPNSSRNSSINGNSKSFEYKNLVDEIIPDITFEDLILNGHTKQMIFEFIEEQLRVDLLRSYNMEPRNRLLLIGPPGNGKTSIAQAISNALTIPLFAVRYESIVASYLGETAIRLKNLFDFVKTQSCILFFDEFDSIAKERGDLHETGEIKRVVSSLLLQIDKLPSYVCVIAATNHPELLDRAVWRRFQLKLTLAKPEKNEIEEFLIRYQKVHNFEFGFPIATLSQSLKNLSYSEIRDFCDNILRKYVLSLPTSLKEIKQITSQMMSSINAFE